MAFDPNQPSYQALRQLLAERTRRVVLFCGAGLSRPTGLPSWATLKTQMLKTARANIAPRDPLATKREQAWISLAEDEKNDQWLAFRHIRSALGETEYKAEVRTQFSRAATVPPPPIYDELWRLPISGIVTLNLDGLTSRAFSQVYSGSKYLTELQGIDCDRHPDLFTAGHLFVVNLHGIISDARSWVITGDDLKGLMDSPAYNVFMQTLFAAHVVLFIGVSADDQAIASHLEKLKSANFEGTNHFWITHRSDSATAQWAAASGVRLIYYSSSDDHKEIADIVADIKKFIPKDEEPPPVKPSTPRQPGFALPSPEDLGRLSAEEIRQALNQEASRLLASGASVKNAEYERFWNNYSEPIHRAWIVNTSTGRNVFMGYNILSSIAKGGFGTIYEGTDANNQRIALKLLHNVAKDDIDTIQSFRRGVRAMRILSKNNVDGMVAYEAAWEIPPCAVMKFVDGPNLKIAVESGQLRSWHSRLKVAIELTRIIQAAHMVPERVLHRDIRPANVMLDDLWTDPDDYKIVVLDFDLAWHKDAPEHSMSITHSVNGFLAPELTSDGEYSSRNALVDSYGLGMTFFFLAAERQPLFAESKYAEWESKLSKEIRSQTCGEWKSLPSRWARIIQWATRPKQPERWDIGRILGELIALKTAIANPSGVVSAELLAEELFARTKEGFRRYTWDINKLSAELEIREGFTIKLSGDESNKRVVFALDWMNTGVLKFENVKKYMVPAVEKAEAGLRSKGWHIERGAGMDSVRLNGYIPVNSLRGSQALASSAAAIDQVIDNLKLGRLSTGDAKSL